MADLDQSEKLVEATCDASPTSSQAGRSTLLMRRRVMLGVCFCPVNNKYVQPSSGAACACACRKGRGSFAHPSRSAGGYPAERAAQPPGAAACSRSFGRGFRGACAQPAQRICVLVCVCVCVCVCVRLALLDLNSWRVHIGQLLFCICILLGSSLGFGKARQQLHSELTIKHMSAVGVRWPLSW
jgi:hypothetical protein